jgi:hypothetical protein
MNLRPLTFRITWCELEDVAPRPVARPRRVVLDVTPDLLPQRSHRRWHARRARSQR